MALLLWGLHLEPQTLVLAWRATGRLRCSTHKRFGGALSSRRQCPGSCTRSGAMHTTHTHNKRLVHHACYSECNECANDSTELMTQKKFKKRNGVRLSHVTCHYDPGRLGAWECLVLLSRIFLAVLRHRMFLPPRPSRRRRHTRGAITSTIMIPVLRNHIPSNCNLACVARLRDCR